MVWFGHSSVFVVFIYRTSHFLDILESFDEHDLDRDGRLSLQEFRQIYDNTKIFEILDKNRDGGITKAELTQLLKNVQDNEHEETTIRPPNRPDNIDVDDDNSQDNELTPNYDNELTSNDDKP